MNDPDRYPYQINPPRVIVLNFLIFFGLLVLPPFVAWLLGW